MAQLAKPGESAVFGISPKMASALTDPVRSRILMEINIRPLSPSQFVEKVGGDLSYVSRCFRQLERWGYAEVVEERPGRRRGAAIEHIYRGIQQAYFDAPTWNALPRSGREAISRSVLDSYFAQVAEAAKAGAFHDPDMHNSYDLVMLDRIAWSELGKNLDKILDLLQEQEVESAQRLAGSDEERIPTTVGLAAFRAAKTTPANLEIRERGYPSAAAGKKSLEITPEVAKALSNKWRSRIFVELGSQSMSPSQFVEEFGGDPSYIARCFRELAAWGFLEIVDERRGGRRGGGIERIYRAAHRTYFDEESWENLPAFLRSDVTNFVLSQYRSQINKALEAGTFDAEPDRHLSWKPVVLDRLAWDKMGDALAQALHSLPDLEQESITRTGDEAEAMIPTVVGLARFRSASASDQR